MELTITQHIKRPLGPVGDRSKNWLFLGVGYTAKAMIARLPNDLNVVGTSRNPDRWPDDLKARVKGVDFSGNVTPELKSVLAKTDVLIISLPPAQSGDPFLSAIDTPLTDLMPNLKWAGYLSATSVYGDRGGQWAFEGEPPRPSLARGLYRAEAEMAWIETGLPVHIFRLAGIYGGPHFGQTRNPFARLQAGEARAVIKPDHVVNRIHVDDIASALWASIARPNPLRIYNLADGAPSPPQDVLGFAAKLCGASPPPRVSVSSEEISDMARSFYSETKRISHARARRELGWEPDYGNYQTGLMSIYKAQFCKPEAVCLSGYLDIPSHHQRGLKDALARHIRLTRAEKGCLRFEVEHNPNIKGRLDVVEVFESKAAFHAHQRRTAASDWAVITQGLPRHYIMI